MTITCGFIGLGNQGAPIARRMIQAGFPTILCDRRSEALEPFRGTTAKYAAGIADLGAQVDHAAICVVSDDDVLQVCGELVPAMRSGSWIAIHSTVKPTTCQTIAQQAGKRGVRVIDAPVSGEKDLRLLGEVVGEHNTSYRSLRDAASPFLELVRTDARS